MVSGDSGCSSPTRPGYSQPYLADYGSVYHHLPGYPPVQGYVPVPRSVYKLYVIDFGSVYHHLPGFPPYRATSPSTGQQIQQMLPTLTFINLYLYANFFIIIMYYISDFPKECIANQTGVTFVGNTFISLYEIQWVITIFILLMY